MQTLSQCYNPETIKCWKLGEIPLKLKKTSGNTKLFNSVPKMLENISECSENYEELKIKVNYRKIINAGNKKINLLLIT